MRSRKLSSKRRAVSRKNIWPELSGTMTEDSQEVYCKSVNIRFPSQCRLGRGNQVFDMSFCEWPQSEYEPELWPHLLAANSYGKIIDELLKRIFSAWYRRGWRSSSSAYLLLVSSSM